MAGQTMDDGFENIRSMTARWVITGELVLQTAAHFGGEGDSLVDMMLMRDSQDGNPLLPGTSIAGALRSYLADVLGGYRTEEHREVAMLFGVARSHNTDKENDEGAQSPLIVFDARVLPDGLNIEIRDGVAIDPATGTAAPNQKFDIEVLPAGKCFPVRFELVVERHVDEERIVALFLKALEGFCNGGISLGMRRSRGLGALQSREWKAVRFDLSSSAGWMQWLTSDYEKPTMQVSSSYESPLHAVRHANPVLCFDQHYVTDQRMRIVLEAFLQIEGDLLIRSPGDDPADPDVIHLHSAGKPVLPGTSLGGVMRSQAFRIAHCVREEHGDAVQWIDRLFGPRIDRKDRQKRIRQTSCQVEPSASRIRISENFLSNRDARRQTRIAIDRFTGGASSGSLFEEQVHVGGSVKVKIELINPENGEMGLLLLLLKDLLTGEIPVGGSSSVGRGNLMGTATLVLEDGQEYSVCSDLTVSDDGVERFTSFIKDFQDASIPEEKTA
jgi:CRISPR/Cas system CSM-associated protein Csm3 (group 7 of RAMP superfamily)